MLSSISDNATKLELRRAALARRDALAPEVRAAAAQALASRPLPVDIRPGTVVAGFSAIRSEIDPTKLMRRVAEAGAQLALPAVLGRGRPLAFRAWAPGEPLRAGIWGIREPAAAAPEVLPDVIFVPLVAFDRAGHRIGYGAGYYDLTLAALRAVKSIVAVGLGFAAQEIQAVPATERDAKLDLVLTEHELIDCRGT
jgi:5-formyltetrahydrofolate cyclo-ligase